LLINRSLLLINRSLWSLAVSLKYYQPVSSECHIIIPMPTAKVLSVLKYKYYIYKYCIYQLALSAIRAKVLG